MQRLWSWGRPANAAPASGPPGGGRKGGGERPVSVAAAVARTADVRQILSGIGTVTARSTVQLKSRVAGQLVRVHFSEGQTVKAGELLAEIDPRPFQVELTKVQGQLARDESLLRNAEADLARFKTLLARGSISQQQVDVQEAAVRQYRGAILADQGQVDSARLQLSFTKVTAPIGGRIGLRLVDAGNNINAGDANALAVITEIQPISVVFSLPEDTAPQVMARLGAGERLPVEAWDRGSRKRLATGVLKTIDNQIDATSGTIKLKAEFANHDATLFPNQFVNVRLQLDTHHDATVVPSAAIQRGPNGPFVYQVGEQNVAEVKAVSLGSTEGDDVEIESGLKPGDRVVVRGADKLRQGAAVDVFDPANPGGPRKGEGGGRPGGPGAVGGSSGRNASAG